MKLFIFAPTALIHCFIYFLTMSSLFLLNLYLLSSLSLCFFLIFLFSSKLFTKSKSLKSSFNFSSNLLFHQGSFFVFGCLLAPTNSETYAAASCIVLFSSLRPQISIFLSTQLTLFTAHFIFAFRIPRNNFNCSLSCSNISFSSPCKIVPCFSAS